jgi:hypothetical protein
MLFTYFEAGQGRGAGLRGYHAAETCHTPGAHVVVLGADGYQVLLRQRHLRHGRPAEYTGVREFTWLYSEKRDTRYFSDSVTFVTGDLESTQGSESTSGCTQSRRIPGTSRTASTSSQATWRVHRGQRVQVVVLRADRCQVLLRQRHLRHRRPAEYRGVREYTLLYSEQTDTRYFTDCVTFVTVRATWRVHMGQRVRYGTVQPWLFCTLSRRMQGTSSIRQEDTSPTFHCFQTMAPLREPGRAEAHVSLSLDADQRHAPCRYLFRTHSLTCAL